MRNRIARIGWLAAMVLLAPLALAQMYKSTMPDGQVIYGDKPVPGAAKVESPKVAPPSKGVTPPSSRETATLQQLEADRGRRNAAEAQLQAAQKALSEAEANLAAGKEPREGERIGTASGASRLNDAYWERQKSLEAAVVEARQNLENVKAGK